MEEWMAGGSINALDAGIRDLNKTKKKRPQDRSR